MFVWFVWLRLCLFVCLCVVDDADDVVGVWVM